MKRLVKAVCLVMVLWLAVMGCGKKSGLEGKVVDGKGNPIAGVKIIAKQVQPVKGYEQFETTTGSDGSFQFSGLFPTSDYTLLPWMQDTKFSASVNIQSGPKGKTVILPAAMAIRFMQTKDGVIKDTVMGLQWTPDSGQKNITWDDAQAYVQGLKTGGFSDWRLPTRAELKSLHDPSIRAEIKIDPLFQLSACCPWTGELNAADSSRAWFFVFIDGFEYHYARSGGIDKRVLAVRSPK